MGLATAIDCAIMLLCSCLGDNKIKEEMERFYGQHVLRPLETVCCIWHVFLQSIHVYKNNAIHYYSSCFVKYHK